MDILLFLPHQHMLLRFLLTTTNFPWGANFPPFSGLVVQLGLTPCHDCRTRGTGDPDPDNQSITPSWSHVNWLKDGHTAQTRPMGISSTTSVEIFGKNTVLSHWGCLADRIQVQRTSVLMGRQQNWETRQDGVLMTHLDTFGPPDPAMPESSLYLCKLEDIWTKIFPFFFLLLKPVIFLSSSANPG